MTQRQKPEIINYNFGGSALKISRLRAIQLEARFADVFGGIDKVPAELLTPAAHFRRIPRTGQVATLVIVESDDGAVGYG